VKVQKTILEDHQIQIAVEVDTDRVEAARRKAARKLAARGKIPGFRPGKAPYEVIVRYYGDATVYEQAVDLVVDEVYPEMLKEANIVPAAAGVLEKIDGTDTPVLTFKVPLTPEVSLGDYHQIRIPYEFQAPGSDKLDQSLEELRQMYGSTETVERAVEEGDYVLLDLKSGNASFNRDGFATIVRGTERQDEFPFPGFARKLLGLSAGDTANFQHGFPNDTLDAALAGQTVEIAATVKAVRRMNLPPLDDELAKMVGQYESLAALREVLTKDLEARARAEYDDEYFAGLVDRVREGAVIKYAPQTLDHEAEHVVDDMRQRLAQQGLDLEAYYKMRNTDAARFFEEEARPVAKKRLERSLILDEVSRVEKIEVDNSSLDQEFNDTLVDLQAQGVKLSAIRGGKQGQQRVAEAVAMQSANRLLTRRTLDRLKAIATGAYVSAEAGSPPRSQADGEESVQEGGTALTSTSTSGRREGKSPRSNVSKKPRAGTKSNPKNRKSSSKK
jgi:trigger factor